MPTTTPGRKARLIRFKEVINRTSKSRASIYTAMKAGRFPTTIKLGPKSVAFIEHEIDEWIEAQAAARDSSSEETQPA
jgi:prophage regulatory protein